LAELKSGKIIESMDKTNLDFTVVYCIFDLLSALGFVTVRLERGQKCLSWQGFPGFHDKIVVARSKLPLPSSPPLQLPILNPILSPIINSIPIPIPIPISLPAPLPAAASLSVPNPLSGSQSQSQVQSQAQSLIQPLPAATGVCGAVPLSGSVPAAGPGAGNAPLSPPALALAAALATTLTAHPVSAKELRESKDAKEQKELKDAGKMELNDEQPPIPNVFDSFTMAFFGRMLSKAEGIVTSGEYQQIANQHLYAGTKGLRG
jgi:hypothetical protein